MLLVSDVLIFALQKMENGFSIKKAFIRHSHLMNECNALWKLSPE